jgi:hypothetical protein
MLVVMVFVVIVHVGMRLGWMDVCVRMHLMLVGWFAAWSVFVPVVRIVVRMRVSVLELLVSMSMRVFWHKENLGLDSCASSRFSPRAGCSLLSAEIDKDSTILINVCTRTLSAWPGEERRGCCLRHR